MVRTARRESRFSAATSSGVGTTVFSFVVSDALASGFWSDPFLGFSFRALGFGVFLWSPSELSVDCRVRRKGFAACNSDIARFLKLCSDATIASNEEDRGKGVES